MTMTKIIYSDDFKAICRTMFPNYRRLHLLLDQNNVLASYVLKAIYMKSKIEYQKNKSPENEMKLRKIVEIINDMPN
ncbi:MAG: hypothetical protein ACFFG0_05505 [Candidatus Thorarchaeota archaeon]